MLISCIIPTYKREALLSEAVLSVLTQEAPGVDVEVVVVNDAGEPLAHADWQDDRRVLVVNTHHTERSVARSTGAALSRGDFLHFLDDDDIALPGAYSALTAVARENHGVVWVVGGYEAILNNGESTATVRPVVDGRLFAMLVAGIGIPMGSCLIERGAFFRAGGFDAAFTVMEDLELLQRVALEGTVGSTDRLVARFRMDRHPLSTTLWGLSSDACRMQREKAFELPGCLSALERSLRHPHSARVRGRLVRFYLGCAARHVRRGSLCTAASRLGVGLRLGVGGLARAEFWRGLGLLHDGAGPERTVS